MDDHERENTKPLVFPGDSRPSISNRTVRDRIFFLIETRRTVGWSYGDASVG